MPRYALFPFSLPTHLLILTTPYPHPQPKTPLAETSSRSIFSLTKHNRAPKLGTPRAEKEVSGLKQRLTDKENQLRVLVSRLKKVKDEADAQVAFVQGKLEEERKAHGETQDELRAARAEGERMNVACEVMQREYFAKKATAVDAQRELGVKSQEGVVLRGKLDAAFQEVAQLKENVAAIEDEKNKLVTDVAVLRDDNSKLAAEVATLRQTVADLESTQLAVTTELESTKTSLAVERLQHGLKIAKLSDSLSAAQTDLSTTRDALAVSKSQRREIHKVLDVEHLKRRQNMGAFKLERARLMRALNDAHVQVDGLKRTLRAADKRIFKEQAYSAEFQASLQLAESRNEKLTAEFKRKERILFSAIASAKRQFDAEKSAKEDALVDVEILKNALAAKDAAFQEAFDIAVQVNDEKKEIREKLEGVTRELAELRVQAEVKPEPVEDNIIDTDSIVGSNVDVVIADKDEDEVPVTANDESDKENCEVAVANMQRVEESSLAKDNSNLNDSIANLKDTEQDGAADQSSSAPLAHRPFGLASTNTFDVLSTKADGECSCSGEAFVSGVSNIVPHRYTLTDRSHHC